MLPSAASSPEIVFSNSVATSSGTSSTKLAKK